jgi:hypothetical protein
MMKRRQKTMKNDEKERKNNEIRLKIWKKTVKNDEQKRKKTRKHDEKE